MVNALLFCALSISSRYGCVSATPKPISIPTSAPFADTFCHKEKAGKFIGWVIYQTEGEVYIACEKADFKQTASGWKRFQHFE